MIATSVAIIKIPSSVPHNQQHIYYADKLFNFRMPLFVDFFVNLLAENYRTDKS